MITLRQLRYLEALTRHRHFGRAAEECAVTQPAVAIDDARRCSTSTAAWRPTLTMQIRDLERELGTDLVERRANEIALTWTGLEIARRGEHILSAVNDLADFARHRGRVLSGPLRLGLIPTLAPYLLRASCRSCKRATPNCVSNCARAKRGRFWRN
jgi:LysR family hydrogen peroxide-inducible transcriptional activator